MRYIIIIQAETFEDVDDVELPRPTQPGDPVEPEFGRCHRHQYGVDATRKPYAGKIICHLP